MTSFGWYTKMFVLAVSLSTAVPCRGEEVPSATTIAQDAKYLINRVFQDMTLLRSCSRVLPEQSSVFLEKLSKSKTANMPILTVARRKLLVITDMQEGNKRRDELDSKLNEIGNNLFNNLNNQPNLKEMCEKRLREPNIELNTSYPGQTNRLLEFHVGYKWSPPGCDYVLLFPVRPEITFVTVSGISSGRAMTPEKESFPFLRAECWPKKDMPLAQMVKMVKSRGEDVQKQQGTSGLWWSETFTEKGYEVVGRAYKEMLGSSVAMTTTILIGEHSFVEILTTEPSDELPSLQAIEFIESIEKH